VPTIVASDDGDLLGVPCYVMTRVPGLVIRDRLPAGFATGRAGRQALGYALADCLAEQRATPRLPTCPRGLNS
jgi:aminoglycoside phosphotransferase (APT) family kinase protein